MAVLSDFAPFFLAMALLAAFSAFFSCSEAALFSLQADDRRRLGKSGGAGRLAIDLLAKPDRLLTAILFWNLIINIVYFALASVIGIQLDKQNRTAEGAAVAVASLLGLIICSEMLPKTFGVQHAVGISKLLSAPLAAAVRVLDPVMPLFGGINRTLFRLIFPSFQRESYLEINDLERAITLSTQDEDLAAQERSSLENIVLLSTLTAEELMRPRKQYQSFTPPVHLEQLGGKLTRSGYLLVTEHDTDEIAAAIPLKHLPNVPKRHLEEFARPVVYVPWCTNVASVLEQLEHQQREVAAIINENGETIGIVTLEDILETIFQSDSSRSARLMATSSIHPLSDVLWQVTGITSLRRLARYFQMELPSVKSVTVAGVLQEQLQRLPEEGDEVVWGPFAFKVISAEDHVPLTAELWLAPEEGVLP